ncbi:hypothetical protein F5I97DRAFT_1951957 [Phlebopus sp. FC_14]|nr:hypothetical protein F5I97DRAFT_1951957 [Phlebopus sp. FC_14]
MTFQQSQLAAILLSGSHLLESGKAAPDRDLKDVLSGRLEKYHSALGRARSAVVAADTVEDLQLETAQCALEVVERVQHLLDVVISPSERMSRDDTELAEDGIPVIGARDLTQLRTLLSLIFRWGTDPLLSSIIVAWPNSPATTQVVDLTNTPAHYRTLTSLLMRLFAILFPRGVQHSLSRTLITTDILHRHMVDLCKASVALGWLPKSSSFEEFSPVDTLRPFVLRLLEFIPLSQVMTDLGAILSSTPPPPTHVRKLCSSLLSKSLLRPEGIRALFAAVFGEQEGPEDPQLEKYEHVGRVLRSVPAGMKPEAYYEVVVPQLVGLVSHSVPTAYRRAASFSIARMLDLAFPHRLLISSIVLSIIHDPLLRIPPTLIDAVQMPDYSLRMAPSQALSTLVILLLNTDPSPEFITLVLSPVVPALYALIFHLDRTKASDPVMKESVHGLLATWGRVVETHEGVDTLCSILQTERIHWEVDSAGDINRIAVQSSRIEKFNLLTPAHVRREQEAWDIGDDPFDLYPNPAHFVRYLKSLNRSDVVSELFVRLLETYHSSKKDSGHDPKRALLYVQMIMEMQTQLSSGRSSSNILSKPDHILLFVKHALGSDSPAAPVGSKRESSQGLRLEDLRIVRGDEFTEGSDNDGEGYDEANSDIGEDNAIETAINLLLATLEANPELSARNAPVLDDIFSLLERFASDPSESTRALAREGRIVMAARLASTSTSWSLPQKTQDEESPQEIYQRALKLLQDPILPVRAHGLLLLRQLVSSCSRPSSTEAALVPAIMSIFMQSVQEEDSYIFLNAVQGLSAMVNVFGKEVLGSLLDTYTHHVVTFHAHHLTKQEMDTKVRVGEALGQVIRRCGDALSIYADIVVPRLILVFRSSQAPTLLRTSAISLLTECMKTSAISLLRYSGELSTSMIDLLQVEMKPASSSKPSCDEVEKTHEVLDSKPMSVEPKLPSLRRAGLHFWTLLLRQQAQAVYDRDYVELPTPPFLRSVKVTLVYIASTDEDHIVRVMAREASDAVDQLNRAMLGI